MDDAQMQENLRYIVHHVFMPPKLPQQEEQEPDFYGKEHTLCQVALGCATRFFDQSANQLQNYRHEGAQIIKMLECFVNLNGPRPFEREDLVHQLENMVVGDTIPLYIRKQNAGVIFRMRENDVVVETFEASANDEAVLACSGRLLCTYPGPSASFPVSVIHDPHFREEISSFLAQMNVDMLDGSVAHTVKDGSRVIEIRDTPHPRYISDLLVGILGSFSGGEDTEVPRLTKRIADDVLWLDSLEPWRRSPVWLVLRVALQTTMATFDGDHTIYKNFLAFMMAEVLQVTLSSELESELLHFIKAKVTRRAAKLGSRLFESVSRVVARVADGVDETLQRRWNVIQTEYVAGRACPDWAPKQMNVDSATKLSLSNSTSYLQQVYSPRTIPNPLTDVKPPKELRPLRNMSTLTLVADRFRSGQIQTNLLDFERAVQRHSLAWSDSLYQQPYPQTLVDSLLPAMSHYFESAKTVYRDDPEAQSTMLLTLYELWAILDRAAILEIPLLSTYPPELSIEAALRPLLLRRQADILRVQRLSGYLRGRDADAIHPSVFAETEKTSFSVRYFGSSAYLQGVKNGIEDEAALAQAEKRKELAAAMERHTSLAAEVESLVHIPTCSRTLRDIAICPRCKVADTVAKITITPHEWPLPADEMLAKAVVFEMACPSTFSMWREATYFLLHDILTDSSTWSPGRPVRGLLPLTMGQSRYKRFLTAKTSRMVFASDTKSFRKTHYKKVPVPCKERAVLLNNGNSWKLYDATKKLWVGDSPKPDASLRCQYRLPKSGLYQSLSFAMGTDHSMNEAIIATQISCPRDLNPVEYLAFGSLRAGGRTQWMNITRELLSDSLTLSAQEVYTLIAQSILQVGNLTSENALDWHLDLLSEPFCHALLQAAENVFDSVQDNWMELTTLRIVAIVAIRILEAMSESAVRERGIRLLTAVRDKTYNWLNSAIEEIEAGGHSNAASNIELCVCGLATTCLSTFDTSAGCSKEFLGTSENVKIFTRCQMAISDYSSFVGKGSSVDELLRRSRKLSHEAENILQELISANSEGLNAAVSEVWSFYKPDGSWKRVKTTSWMACETLSSSDVKSQTVHFNMLSGQLLIDGKSLGQLPAKITANPTFIEFFGKRRISVVPSDDKTMEYMTRKPIFEHQLFFSEEKGKVTIRARRNSNAYFELVPSSIFVGDMPLSFVEDHAFWLRLGQQLSQRMPWIELRPRGSMWTESDANWSIHATGKKPWTNAQLRLRNRQLIDIRSRTFKMVLSRLRSLEHADFIVVTKYPWFFARGHHRELKGRPIHVELPRFRLSFFLDERGNLRSQNIPRSIVDLDQGFGTWFGLSNCLVLSETIQGQEFTRLRRVIVPIGTVKCHPTHNHVVVDISIDPASRRVGYHDYVIDTELGGLIGNATLESSLYKLYLHALTTYVVPDPLTHQTGVKVALDELCSASCTSFQSLEPSAIKLLMQIRRLTPRRSFYPPGKSSMQTIEWSSGLSVLSQHSRFETRVCEIYSFARDLLIFSESTPEENSLLHSQLGKERTSDPSIAAGDHLANRAWRPYSTILPEYREVSQRDTPYYSRAYERTGGHFHREVSLSILNQDLSVISHIPTPDADLESVFCYWQNLLNDPGSATTISYSRKWLTPNAILNRETFLALYTGSQAISNAGDTNVVQSQSWPGVLFSLSSLAFELQEAEDPGLIWYLLAGAIVPELHFVVPPLFQHFDLQRGMAPSLEDVQSIIDGYARPRVKNTIPFAQTLLQHWPSDISNLPLPSKKSYNTPEKLLEEITALFSECFKNRQLLAFAELLDRELKARTILYHPVPHSEESASKEAATSPLLVLPTVRVGDIESLCRLPDIIAQRIPPDLQFLQEVTGSMTTNQKLEAQSSHSLEQLDCLAMEFEASEQSLQTAYGKDMRTSIRDLRHDISQSELASQSNYTGGQIESLPGPQELRTAYQDNRDIFQKAVDTIVETLTAKTETEKLLAQGGYWPRLTVKTLLSQMTRTGCWLTLGLEWRTVFVKLGLIILRMQRSRRLFQLSLRHRNDELLLALEKDGELSFEDAITHPDWLLFQIENDLIIRPVQVEVAHEMFSPQSGANTVLQLNMGEGKSSIITPMVAASLANGSTLVRVVVLKSLSREMFQIMVQRLTGLLNRRVCYFPFSRRTKLGQAELDCLLRLYEGCVKEGGVLVVQPEHILSSKLLLANELVSSGDSAQQSRSTEAIVSRCIRLQNWFERFSRDILDESDELLHVRYQLIYTVGKQQPIEGQPYRWKIVQNVLSLVAESVKMIGSSLMQIWHPEPWAYPFMQFSIDNDGLEALDVMLRGIAQEIVDSDPISGLSTTHLDEEERVLLVEFLLSPSDNVQQEQGPLRQLFDQGISWNIILLLRGLLGHGLLLHALREKRWRVDYGLDLSRSLLAVPYRAKDVPSSRAEYGHADMAIVLTCLAYYYYGLTSEQVATCFRRLFRHRNPGSLYASWTRVIPEQNLPRSIASVRGINVEDGEQHSLVIYPLFRRNKVLIDFYLSDTVFPLAAKEFPHKLPCSGWDLAETKSHPTTGFSGTKDNRFLLPTSISQEDVVGQGGTNALVLAYLLQHENDSYRCTMDDAGRHMSGKAILQLISQMEPPIRVLLDVGAQMLDMHNIELVKCWLNLNARFSSIEAAVFFDTDDQLTVLMRDGTTEPFVSSPYRQNLGNCIVYLDDAHTRGTDLKLPHTSRAAVTLGPRVTKDRLVQGCMRMRQLGHGQAVVFLAPPEVDSSIWKMRGDKASGSDSAGIHTVDVLRWTMQVTCSELLHYASHWVQQGSNYVQRRTAMDGLPSFPSPADISRVRDAWLLPESRTIEDMYGGLSHTRQTIPVPAEINERLKMLGVDGVEMSNHDEEQEREVSHEVEVERDVERPPRPLPYQPSLHADVKSLLNTGKLRRESPAFLGAFMALRGVRDYKVHVRHLKHQPQLLVTADFAHTVIETNGTAASIDYLKPVHWLLTSRSAPDCLIILSQHEVNALLPDLRSSKHVRLHMYSARISATSQSLDDLLFYCVPSTGESFTAQIPRALVPQLNMFAGQLFPSSYQHYRALCNFLGLDSTPRTDRLRNRFVLSQYREGAMKKSPFQNNPTRFFKELFSIRRKGQEIDSTPVGRMLNGRRLLQSEFTS